VDVNLLRENAIWAEFWKRYFGRPEGWRIYSGISTNGYPELLINGEKESWLVRRDSLYSGKLGIGGRISGDIKMDPRVDPFGFREIPRRYLERILAMDEGFDPVEKTKMITDILKKPPTTLDRIRSPGAIQGPMVRSYQALPLISNEQAKLDKELNMEMDKWKRRIPYLQ
jgi:hypothetical protein